MMNDEILLCTTLSSKNNDVSSIVKEESRPWLRGTKRKQRKYGTRGRLAAVEGFEIFGLAARAILLLY